MRSPEVEGDRLEFKEGEGDDREMLEDTIAEGAGTTVMTWACVTEKRM